MSYFVCLVCEAKLSVFVYIVSGEYVSILAIDHAFVFFLEVAKILLCDT